MKKCRLCLNILDESCFSKANNGGLRTECKTCANAYAKAKYQENRPKILEQHKNWKHNNPDKIKIYPHSKEQNATYCSARRARKRNAEGSYTSEEWESLKSFYGNRCLRCGSAEVLLTPDHVIPLAIGGSNYINNIQPLCKSCNSKKQTKTIDYRKEGVLCLTP